MTAEIIFIQFTFHLICFYFIIEQTGEACHEKKVQRWKKSNVEKYERNIMFYVQGSIVEASAEYQKHELSCPFTLIYPFINFRLSTL